MQYVSPIFRTLLARFLFLNLLVFFVLGFVTFAYLKSIEPELVKEKNEDHQKLINNISLNMSLQNVQFKKDSLRIFLTKYKSLLPNINLIRLYDNKKNIVIDSHSLDLGSSPFFKIDNIQQKNIKETDSSPDTSSLTTREESEFLDNLIAQNLSILGNEKILTISKKIGDNFLVISLSALFQNNDQRGFIAITEISNDIENAITERKNFVLRSVGAVAIIILVFSIFLNANIIKPIRILGRFATSATVDTPDNKIINIINTRDDEIGSLSRSLSTMTANLYQRIEFAERFSSELTHEIRNPLASLKAASELIPETQDLQKRERLIRILIEDVSRIERLITDYSKMLRDEAQQAKFGLDKFDLVEIIQFVINNFGRILDSEKKKISIQFNYKKEKKFLILGFRRRIEQVILNILDNSISFSPKNGIVDISLEIIKKNIKIVISDDGPGFDEKNINKIFNRFYSDRPDQKFGQHSGLGLNIVKNIVESHKGDIKAYNKVNEGRGAVVEINLPLAS